MVYAKMHRLIGEIVTADQPAETWRRDLKSAVAEFAAASDRLDPRTARQIRDELCTQFEHEALSATRRTHRAILLTALKNLEAMEWQPPMR